MAQVSVVSTSALDYGYVLTPERYDPRRNPVRAEGRPLREFVDVRKEVLTPSKMMNLAELLALDTNNAREGFVQIYKNDNAKRNLKSSKKIIRKGDVIISRLRPYLRQVAAVWGLPELEEPETTVCVSTEFYVLRGYDEEILWIAPFILSEKVQTILCSAQEGGHHPRFDLDTLLDVCVPTGILDERNGMNCMMKEAAEKMQQARRYVEGLIRYVND